MPAGAVVDVNDRQPGVDNERKPAVDRIILDSGSKTLTADQARGFAPLTGHGAIVRNLAMPGGARPADDLIVERLSEEHATVRVVSGTTSLEPGDRVRIIPNHSCVVSNLVDAAWIVEGERVLESMPIAARGRIT